MPVLCNRVGVAGSAVLTVCLLAGGAGSAFAATAHSTTTSTAAHTHSAVHGGHSPKSRPVDHLAGPRKGARKALAADTARLTRITAAAAASTVLDADDQAALATAEAAGATALSADGQAIAAAGSVKTLHTVTLSATRTVQGAQLQLHIVTGADEVKATDTALTADAATLASQADALAAAGTDVSTVTAPLTDLATQVSIATSNAQNATTVAFTLPAAPSVTQIHAVKTTAHGELDTAGTALDTAGQDLTTATAALATLTGTPVPDPTASTRN